MFTFGKKQKPLYMCIKEIFSTGAFYDIKSTNACRYTISEKYTLINIINLNYILPPVQFKGASFY